MNHNAAILYETIVQALVVTAFGPKLLRWVGRKVNAWLDPSLKARIEHMNSEGNWPDVNELRQSQPRLRRVK